MNKYILTFIVMMSLFCKAQNNAKIELELKKCIDKGALEHCEDIIDCEVDFYSLMNEVESILVEGTNKEDYLKVLKQSSAKNVKKLLEERIVEIEKLFWDNKFDPTHYFLWYPALKGCPNKIRIDNKLPNEHILYRLLLMMNKLEATGMVDNTPLLSFVEGISEENFNKPSYRHIVILLTYKMDYSKYELAL